MDSGFLLIISLPAKGNLGVNPGLRRFGCKAEYGVAAVTMAFKRNALGDLRSDC